MTTGSSAITTIVMAVQSSASVEPGSERPATSGVGVVSWCGATATTRVARNRSVLVAELASARAATKNMNTIRKRTPVDLLCMQARSISPGFLAMFILNMRIHVFCSIMRPRATKKRLDLAHTHERYDDFISVQERP